MPVAVAGRRPARGRGRRGGHGGGGACGAASPLSPGLRHRPAGRRLAAPGHGLVCRRGAVRAGRARRPLCVRRRRCSAPSGRGAAFAAAAASATAAAAAAAFALRAPSDALHGFAALGFGFLAIGDVVFATSISSSSSSGSISSSGSSEGTKPASMPTALDARPVARIAAAGALQFEIARQQAFLGLEGDCHAVFGFDARQFAALLVEGVDRHFAGDLAR